MDYFTLLGMPNCFDIDKQQLVTRYQDMQRQYHPDRFAGKSDKEQVQAISFASTINQAYQTLKIHSLELNTYSHYTVSILPMSNKQCTILHF